MKFHRIYTFILLVIVSLLILSCKPQYYATNFEAKTATHKIIAVLPIEMHFIGQIPEKWTLDDIRQIEEAESQAFQISFYNEILRSTKSGRKPIRVDIQHYNKTWQLLEDHEIGIRESWRMSREKLALVLGVDAVVSARIKKTRFMSDLESYGIEVATEIVNIITDHKMFPFIPITAQNKEIVADYAVVDKNDGITLWSISFKVGADWRQPANQIIDNISRRAARNFPYRLK